MRIISRLVYLVAGLSALYMAIAPTISGVPSLRSAWVTTAFWCGAILLMVAALGTHDLVDNSALIGSSVIVALYGCLAMMPILARLGYYHLETRLVAMREPPRWRFVFDKPVLFLLLFSALAALGLSLQGIVEYRKRERSQHGSGSLAR